MAEIFEWDKALSVGVTEIDEQHKKIFELIQGLSRIIGRKKDEKDILALLDEMSHYAEHHFTTEQRYLEKYPHFSSHAQEHKHFILKTAELKESISQGQGDIGLICHKALVFLVSWLKKHIMDHDRKAFAFLRENR